MNGSEEGPMNGSEEGPMNGVHSRAFISDGGEGLSHEKASPHRYD